ncbi:MAG: GerMN domain-containing protein [Candidatus Sumerlaeota bacterium]|nr:GerMN domain-containing protein [Candidatus Sumerlaeota bacterium]
MPDREKIFRGEFARFLLSLGMAAVVITVLGLYFINKLFNRPHTSPRVDFSQALKETLLTTEAPASPNTVRVFFTTNGRHLSAEVLELSRSLTPYERIDRLLTRLMKGPTNRYFEPVLPANVSLRAMYILEDRLVVDFSKELSQNFHGGLMAEMLAVYSIADTIILNVPEIKQVQILIDGEMRATLAGGIDLSAPLGANINLIRW